MSAELVRTVSVTGAASVSTKPDRASLSLGVQSRRPRAHSAMRDVEERAATLISALRDAGARDEDLRTTGLSLWFDQTEREYSASYTVNVADAQAKARVLAAAADCELGPVVSIVEGGGGPTPVYKGGTGVRMAMAAP